MNLVKQCTMNCSGRTVEKCTIKGGYEDCEDCEMVNADLVTATFDCKTHKLISIEALEKLQSELGANHAN